MPAPATLTDEQICDLWNSARAGGWMSEDLNETCRVALYTHDQWTSQRARLRCAEVISIRAVVCAFASLTKNKSMTAEPIGCDLETLESLARKSLPAVRITRRAMNGEGVTLWVSESEVRATDEVHP